MGRIHDVTDTPTGTGFTMTAVTLGGWANQRTVSATVHGCWVGAVSVSEFHAATTRH